MTTEIAWLAAPKSEAPVLPDAAIIPDSIRQAYQLDDEITAQSLTGGHVNNTLLVSKAGQYLSILQRQSSAVGTDVLFDAAAVSNHLATAGWEAPTIIPTVTGKLYAKESSGEAWRQQHFIDSDGRVPQNHDAELLASAGDLLGRWHHTTRQLAYVPRFGIPHFHDTDHYAYKLEDYDAALSDERTRALAATLLSAYKTLPSEADDATQVIHGDPKLDNMLFRDGRPFTLIDFDTLMVGSTWIDVGDLSRSLIAKQLSQDRPTSAEDLRPLVDGYHETVGQRTSTDQSFHSAMRATGRIALELGMRYLCDTVEKNYFQWDDARYTSRSENHYHRAVLQLAVARLALTAIE